MKKGFYLYSIILLIGLEGPSDLSAQLRPFPPMRDSLVQYVSKLAVIQEVIACEGFDQFSSHFDDSISSKLFYEMVHIWDSTMKISYLPQRGFFSKSYPVFVRVEMQFIESKVLFYLAVNPEKLVVYRLKGFLYNDFPEFYHSIDWRERKKIRNPKRFAHEFSVEGVDFQCLMEAMKSGKNSPLDVFDIEARKKYPCLDHVWYPPLLITY